MKRIIFALLAAVVLAGLFTPSANAASGDSARHRNAACVTKAEYKKIKRGHTMAYVKRVFGTNGRTSSTIDSSYEEWVWGDYVEGYEDRYSVPGYHDEWTGEWVPAYWEYYWVDGYWEDDYSYWVSAWDSNRDYKKCSSWNRGRGRVAINFDNYTSAYGGFRVYSKAPNRPWIWDALGLRTTSDETVLGDKIVPDATHDHASGHRTKADAMADKEAARAKTLAEHKN